MLNAALLTGRMVRGEIAIGSQQPIGQTVVCQNEVSA